MLAAAGDTPARARPWSGSATSGVGLALPPTRPWPQGRAPSGRPRGERGPARGLVRCPEPSQGAGGQATGEQPGTTRGRAAPRRKHPPARRSRPPSCEGRSSGKRCCRCENQLGCAWDPGSWVSRDGRFRLGLPLRERPTFRRSASSGLRRLCPTIGGGRRRSREVRFLQQVTGFGSNPLARRAVLNYAANHHVRGGRTQMRGYR